MDCSLIVQNLFANSVEELVDSIRRVCQRWCRSTHSMTARNVENNSPSRGTNYLSKTEMPDLYFWFLPLTAADHCISVCLVSNHVASTLVTSYPESVYVSRDRKVYVYIFSPGTRRERPRHPNRVRDSQVIKSRDQSTCIPWKPSMGRECARLLITYLCYNEHKKNLFLYWLFCCWRCANSVCTRFSRKLKPRKSPWFLLNWIKSMSHESCDGCVTSHM